MKIQNPQNPRVILYKSQRKTVEHGKEYLVITDHEGIEHKLSEKRRKLWELFEKVQVNDVFVIVYETYHNIEYAADVQTIKDAMANRAVQNLAKKAGDQQVLERVRSQAVSYSKDAWIADKIERHDILTLAQEFTHFIITGEIYDEQDKENT